MMIHTTNMQKRVLSFLLAVILLLNIAPQYVFAEEESIAVLLEGTEITELVIPQDEKKELEAAYSDETQETEYRWQILADQKEQLWVNISEMTGKSATVSYALLYNLLDMSGSAYLRVIATTGEKEVVSQPVCITISFHAQIPTVSGNGGNDASVTEPVSETLVMSRERTVQEYVYLTINYRDSVTNESIFESYVGQIEVGTDFEQDVLSPTFLGFAPYYNADAPDSDYGDATTASAGVISLDYENLTEDKVINVYYVPIAVPYSVRYFFQNIHDDHYTEDINLYYSDTAITGTIISDEQLALDETVTTGFTKLYHYPETVAADGSTVFECYYDRNYTLLKFNMDGGYGVEPLYARYDAPFVINPPTKSGYVFSGWDLLTDEDGDGVYEGDGIADTLPTTVPAQNRQYKALWETSDTTVTYVYWTQNANDNAYSYWGSEITSAKSSDVVSGYDGAATVNQANPECCIDYKYFTYDEEKTDKEVVVEGDGSTVVNVYYTRNTYTLQFYYARSYDEGDSTIYQVVGGTTYYFGKTGNNPEAEVTTRLTYTPDNQWGKVKSEPVLKEQYTGADGPYTTGTTVASDNKTYYYLSFEARYMQDISNLWPVDVFQPVLIDETHTNHSTCYEYAYFSAWNGEYKVKYTQENSNQTIKGLYQILDKNLLFADDFTDSDTVSYLCFWENGADVNWSVPKQFIYDIYLETSEEGYSETPTYSFNVYDNSTIDQQTVLSFNGYMFERKTSVQEENNSDGMPVYRMSCYYLRNNYTLTLHNYNTNLEELNVTFNDNIASAISEIEVPYPDTLEPGAYHFEGWYTSPGCYGGTELTDAARIEGNLTLYAKWAPNVHTVKFYKTYSDMIAGSEPFETREIKHGFVAGDVETPDYAENGLEYTFSGWFYMNQGVKTAFTPLDSYVTKDLDLFAEWGYQSAQPYQIQYVLKSDNSVEVAEPTLGYAYLGSTRTFSAKSGDPYNQLYDAYNIGYFPTVASHSLVIQYESDKANPTLNTFMFEYVTATNVQYTINYIDKLTGVVMETVTKTTNNGVVTERFKVFANYVPDAFYKRLVISVEDDGNGVYVGTEDNVINFYYTPSETTAFYAVHYMMQEPNTDGTNYAIDGSGDYTESTVSAEGTGNIGETISITPPMFTGFSVVNTPAYSVVDGVSTALTMKDDQFQITVSQNGTELYIFYARNSYPYTVQYIDYNMGNTLKDDKQGENTQFGTYVTESPVDIPGYKPVSDAAQTLLIRADSEKNVITFYYIPEQYTIEYIAVGLGTLSTTTETVTGGTSSELSGSIPIPKAGCRFVGWYMDEACTIPISEEGVVDNTGKLMPDLTKLTPAPGVNTFYAKFEEMLTTLTITRTNADCEDNNDAVFVYKITNMDDANLVIYVSITGNGSTTVTDIRQGTYSIEQVKDWSWRFDDETKTIELSGEPSTIVFDSDDQNSQWLSGNSTVEVNKKGGQ